MLFRYISFTCFSADPNRLKYHQNQLPSGVRIHTLETLFSQFSLQCQIVQKRMYNVIKEDANNNISYADKNLAYQIKKRLGELGLMNLWKNQDTLLLKQ